MTIEQLFGHDASSVSEDHFEKVFGTLGEGPIEGAANECEVVASGPVGMTVEVQTGTFVTGGVFARVSAQDVLVIGVADPINPRIDRIVCRRDNATDQVTVYVLAGVAAGVPVPPALTRVGGVWEISLAQIYVAAAVVVINAADITDERHDYDVCGFATSRGRRGVEILDRDLTQVTIANDAVERSIYSFTIPAHALGATGGFRLTLGGDMVKNFAGTLELRIYLGGVLIMTSTAFDPTIQANAYRWTWQIWMQNSAAAVQKWNTWLQMISHVLDFSVRIGNSDRIALGEGQDQTAVDTVDPVLLDITVDWSAANANLNFRKEEALLELIPPA